MQAPANADGQSALGFDAVTHSWPFVIVFYFTLLNLSCVTSRRLLFHWRDYAFYLNHLGLLVLLYAGGFGASPICAATWCMWKEAPTEWRVYNEKDDVLGAAFEHKGEWFLYGGIYPEISHYRPSHRRCIRTEIRKCGKLTLRERANIAGWNIQAENTHEAVRKSDSTYQQIPMPGSCPAALVKLRKQRGSL